MKLPLGISDFKELREENYYYVDKSLFIKEVIDRDGKVILLPRPRRFGKTLNLSMLRYFFEAREESLAHLFAGLAIEAETKVMQQQGQYPVIFLTFKDCKEPTLEKFFGKIRVLLQNLYSLYETRLYPNLRKHEQQYYDTIMEQRGESVDWEEALQFLMRVLRRHNGKRVIVLLDEYDTPIHAGQEHGYYEDVISFMRNLMSGALKDNSDLEKGVVIGILRITFDTIFSGLNNLDVFSLLEPEFEECFGFTETDIKRLIADFGLNSTDAETLKIWYDGYMFGNKVIYNPWSVVNFIASHDQLPRPYWINTSSNLILRDLVTHSEPNFQAQMEILLAGDAIQSPLNENVVLRDLTQSDTNIWSLLVFSGYLKPVRWEFRYDEFIYELAIPNREVRSFYRETIKSWLHQMVSGVRLQDLLQALLQTNWKTFGKLLKDMVLAILSYHDTAGKKPEKVYHAFVLGLLTNLSDRYQIRSNRESGYGRYDVLMIPHQKSAPGFVFEFKKIDSPDDKDEKEAMQSALQQIKDREYATELQAQGVKCIWGVGVVVEGKQVWVESVLL
jgi:hypothetical protein